MPQAQLKISSFFKSPKAKQNLELPLGSSDSDSECLALAAIPVDENDQNHSKQVTNKRKLTTDDLANATTPSKIKLSNVDRSTIQDNEMAAKLKMIGTKTNGLVVNIGSSWLKALEPEFSKPYFLQLSEFVASERKKVTVYPPVQQVFTWTNACKIKDVKVVILGQDPYHGPGQAHGLCFSVLPGIKPPPSLANIFKELKSDIDGFTHPGHGNLIGWANQGVLLLNACLTVRSAAANSHAGKGWEKLTDAVIQWLNTNLTGVVFMLWGAYAQKKGACIDKKKHYLLTSVHPSPLSAHRGFLGCKHFSQCNALLKVDGKSPIDWCHLPKSVDI